MMELFIEPSDVWFFRDARAFDAGADHYARSLFPPTPMTMQGIIRSHILMERGVSLLDYTPEPKGMQEEKTRFVAEEIGRPGGGMGRLHLRGPLVARRERNEKVMRYFPMPADVVRRGDEYLALHPLTNGPFHSNLPGELYPLWLSTIKRLEEAKGWGLAQPELERYLLGEAFEPVKSDELFVSEARFGIKVERRRYRPEERYLYQIAFVRPQEGVGLWVEVDGVEFKARQGLIAVGGENRAATYEVIKTTPVPQPEILPQRFKLYFATPAYFCHGWQPEDWGHFFEGQVRLVATALPRPQFIGGWDIVRKQQKPMRRYVPAGSVYFFETLNGPVRYKGCPLTESPSGESEVNLGQMGFGMVFVGSWHV